MKKKYKLYFSTVVVMLATFFLPNKYISLFLAVVFSIGVAFFLYKNISLLIDPINDNEVKGRTLKEVLVFFMAMVLLAVIGVVLAEKNIFTEFTERMFANVYIILVMVWFGNIAGKIPFNGVIGLRLPWMLLDEETWNIGHRLLGYCSLPLSVIYLVLIPLINNKTLAISVMALWIAIPGIGSYIFFKRKHRN